MPFGFIKPWSAISDAIKLRNGGYALTGSGTLNIDGNWYGLTMVLDANRNVKWFKFMRIRKEQTFSLQLFQLHNGHIVVAGYDSSISDIFLINFSKQGKPSSISILHIRGQEIPVGFTALKTGAAIVAQQTMASGESAAIIIRLSPNGSIKGVERYQYKYGFNPHGIIYLPNNHLCIYGATETNVGKKSIAIVVDDNDNPTSALELKGGEVFVSGALIMPGKLIFVGTRSLGVKRHLSGSIIKWLPSIKNDVEVVKNMKHGPVKFTVYNNQSAIINSPTNPSLHKFDSSEMRSRPVSGSPKSK